MLINLRNALMTGKRLPYDAEVEYLATTGGQYINTGIIGSSATKVEITAYSTNTSTIMALFGARNTSNGNRPSYSIWQRTSVAGGTGMRFDYNSASADSFAVGNWDASTDNTITKDNVSNYINGTLASVNTARSFSLDIPFYLGTINGSGTPATYYFVGRIYSCKIWDNGVLVRDYIPVRKGTVGYLYDRVSGALFGNAGTGDFTLGPDVVPVEYLQSSGTQWIDTGVVPAANDTYTVETRKLNANQDNASFGLASVVYCFANPSGTFWSHPALGSGGRNGINPLGNTNWHTIVVSPTSVTVDGVALGDRTSDTQSPLSTVKLFARGENSASGGVAKQYNGMISHAFVNRGGLDLRKFYAVRVGTDATSWEGAMMDTLTRRIYRNAGTGAFTYGNDLKYPIPAE